jgi:glycosyltransferase involved in cell wall biosynthesis
MTTNACIIVPAYQAERTILAVIEACTREMPGIPIFVIDDGSRDDTAPIARKAGARVVSQPHNMGKGVALRTGFERAFALGYDVALTIDADEQHPANEGRRVLEHPADPGALVLGVRDLVRDGAPKKNRMSNGISNFFLSGFSGRILHDTQCGMRRYPLARTLALSASAPGYAYEAEIILRALAAKVPVVEVPVQVYYPPEEQRVTHFDSVKDPARIVMAVVRTLVDVHVLHRQRTHSVQ